MTPIDATNLAVRILKTFTGPAAEDWEEELLHLDAGRAGTAFARLRREHDHQRLSIAHFLSVYRSLNTEDGSTKKPECGWCDGTGWTQTKQRHQLNGNVYSGVEPCTRCDEGRAREVSETWTKSPERQFISDAEADRLIKAIKEIA